MWLITKNCEQVARNCLESQGDIPGSTWKSEKLLSNGWEEWKLERILIIVERAEKKPMIQTWNLEIRGDNRKRRLFGKRGKAGILPSKGDSFGKDWGWI